MFAWLLLVTISQLWLSTRTPSQENGPYRNLAVLKPQTPIRYEVLVKNRDVRRHLRMELTKPKKAARDESKEAGSAEKKSTLKVSVSESNSTRLYWNRTHERCDYERIRCMRASATGAVCARTLFYQYYSFPNYCALEFHNCVGRYEGIWSIAYMGICTELDIEKQFYVDLSYKAETNISFLTQMYIEDSGDLSNVG